MLGDEFLVDQVTDRVLVDEVDLGYLMRGAKAVEEVKERDAGLHGGQMGHQGQVLGLLDR